jgi:5-hydroxyisourate hydrolase
MSSAITTHVLDQQRGRPAVNLEISLLLKQGESYIELAKRITNADGRVTDFLAADSLKPGVYRLIFQTGNYFLALGQTEFFYPAVIVEFETTKDREHYHVPLLLSPFGYSTYRGS